VARESAENWAWPTSCWNRIRSPPAGNPLSVSELDAPCGHAGWLPHPPYIRWASGRTPKLRPVLAIDTLDTPRHPLINRVSGSTRVIASVETPFRGRKCGCALLAEPRRIATAARRRIVRRSPTKRLRPAVWQFPVS